MLNILTTFTAVTEAGAEYTVDLVASDGVGAEFGNTHNQFIGRGIGLLNQLSAELFQAEAHPELILTTKAVV